MGYRLTGVYMRPNGTEQRIRPTQWKPGANTLAYYPLKSDFKDYSGNGKDGTVTGNYTFTTNSCYFDGGYVNIPAPTGAITTGELTLSIWLKLGTPIAGGPYNRYYGHIFGQWYEGTDSKSVTSLSYYWPNGSASTSYQCGAINTLLDNNTFYNIVWVFENGSNDCTVYVNGQLFGTTTNTNYSGFNKIGNANWYINYFNNGWSVKPTIGDAIIEDRKWTAQDASDYFDITKADYSIS